MSAPDWANDVSTTAESVDSTHPEESKPAAWLTCPAKSPTSRVWFYLRRQVGESRHPVGVCQEPHPDPQVDDECGGPLFYTPTALNPVTCANCGWDVSQGAIDIYVAQTDLHLWKEAERA